VETVDNSRHAQPNSRNSRTQTFDCRVLASEIPGVSPAEKLSVLHSFFRGVTSLKSIYSDEIYKMDYFILQFTKLLTMRSMVRKFNEFNDYHAVMTPMSYTRKRHHDKLPSPGNKTFKIIDLDGSETQKQQAVEEVVKILRMDNIQLMEDQPSEHELRFWVPTNAQASLLQDIWALPVGDNIVRIGPSTFTGQEFLNRNKWVGKSTAAAKFTTRKLLDNLEVIGVKNVFKQPTNKDKVYFAFDTEENYLKAISRGIFMDTTKLHILPVTPYSRLDAAKFQKGKGRFSRANSPKPDGNTSQQTPSLSVDNHTPCPTGSNRVKLGYNKWNKSKVTETTTSNTYSVLGDNPTYSS
jgi:hypothetical protein